MWAQWNSPQHTNGILRGYRVTCTVLEDYNKPLYLKNDTNVTNNAPLEITGLSELSSACLDLKILSL